MNSVSEPSLSDSSDSETSDSEPLKSYLEAFLEALWLRTGARADTCGCKNAGRHYWDSWLALQRELGGWSGGRKD